MSRGAFNLRDTDRNAYNQGYYQGYDKGYKAALFNNLPSGIVYGEGQETRHYLPKQLRYPYHHRCLYHGLHCLGLCPPVSCPFEEKDDARLQ